VFVKRYMDIMAGSMAEIGYCRADDGQGMSFPATAPFLSPAAVINATAAWASAVAAVAQNPKQLERVQRGKLPTHYVLLVRWSELRGWARSHGVAWPAPPTKRATYEDFMQQKNATNGAPSAASQRLFRADVLC